MAGASKRSPRVGWLAAAVTTGVIACGGDGEQTAGVDPGRFPPGLPGRVDSIANAALAAGPLAGLSIAIAADGEPVFAGSWGVADVRSGARVDRGTLYDVSSLTASITAAAAVRLSESGRLDLDQTLDTAVPGLAAIVPGADRIRLRHLLTNTSGLSDFVGDATTAWIADRESVDRDAVLEAAARPAAFAPGEAWSESHTAFRMAGEAIGRAAGVSYAAFVRDSVAGPLGLADTYLCDERPAEPRRVSVHEPGQGGLEISPLDRMPGFESEAGLCMTIEDLVRIPGAFERGGVITPAGVEEMLAPTTLANGIEVDYGLGVRLGSLEGHRLWGNRGGVGSTRAILMHFPDDGLTLAVLQNTDGVRVDALSVAGNVARALLGLPPPVLEPVPALDLDRYAGRYIEADGEYTMAVNADSLIRSRGDSNALVPLGAGLFGWRRYPMDRFRFHDIAGAVVGVSEYYNGLFAEYHPRKAEAGP